MTFPLITEGEDIVQAAVVSLMTFGGHELDRETAARLLPMWSRYSELTAYGVAAVLAHFLSAYPESSLTEQPSDATGNSGPGWPLGGPS